MENLILLPTNTLRNFLSRIEDLNKKHEGFPLLFNCAKVLQKLSLDELTSLIGEGLAPFLADKSSYRVDFDPNGFISVPISKPWRSLFPNIHLSLHLFPPILPKAEGRAITTGEPHFHPHGDGFISRTLIGGIRHEFVTPRADENGTHQGYFRYFDSYKGPEPKVKELGRFTLKHAPKKVSYYPIVSEQSRVRDLCLMTTSPVHEVTTDEKTYTATLMLTPNRTAKGQEVYLPCDQNYEQILPQNRRVISPAALQQTLSRIPIFNS